MSIFESSARSAELVFHYILIEAIEAGWGLNQSMIGPVASVWSCHTSVQ